MVTVQSALTVFAPDALRLYLGHPVTGDVVLVLRISAFVAVISAPSLVVSQYVLGIGSTHWMAIMAISSGAINLLGGVILVPRLGLAGAAWSDLVAIVGTRPLIHYFIWRRHLSEEISLHIFIRRLYGATLMGIPMTLMLMTGRDHFSEWRPGWFGLSVAAGVAACVVMSAVLLADGFGSSKAEGIADVRLLLGRLRRKFAP